MWPRKPTLGGPNSRATAPRAYDAAITSAPKRLRSEGFSNPHRLRTGARASLLLLLGAALAASPLSSWPQWGGNPQHTGAVLVLGQPLSAILADIVYDPFVTQEAAEGGGGLYVHYPVPLVDGNDVYMEHKSGRYVSCDPPGSGGPVACGPDAWNSQVWSVRKFSWEEGALVEQWTFQSDWKPEPTGFWEPVFHPALSGEFLYVPGLGATVHKVSKATGEAAARLNPFGDLDPSRYVAGGLGAGPTGDIVYNALELSPVDPWSSDAAGSWLVRIAPDEAVAKVDFATLIPGAPGPTDLCRSVFSPEELPWPPSPAALPPAFPCGSQRPGLNVVPAFAEDGTIYTVSRAHHNDHYGFLVAVRPDLTPSWSASFRGILDDGCDVLLPPSGTPGGCRTGAARGVDPATNERPAGRISDASTSSPVVLPDGSILYGALTRYNYGRGHLFQFSATGDALGTYDFGWDITPAVYARGNTYSVVLKDNHYGVGSYCSDPALCPAANPRYDLVSLDADLVPEWTFTNTETQACARQPDGTIVCEPGLEGGFEWCVNQPAIDLAGTTYANSEDGYLYAIGRDGTLRERIFLNLAIGAAYTPLSLGQDGRIYSQNNGRLFAVGLPIAFRGTPLPSDGAHETRVVARP